jgi:hypothetical protein
MEARGGEGGRKGGEVGVGRDVRVDGREACKCTTEGYPKG